MEQPGGGFLPARDSIKTDTSMRDAAAPESPVLTVVDRDARSERVYAFNTGGMPPGLLGLFKTHGIDLTPNARKGPADFYNLKLMQQKTPLYAGSFQLRFRPPTAQLYLAEDQKGRFALWVAGVEDEAGAKAVKEDLKSFLEKPADSSTPTDAAPTFRNSSMATSGNGIDTSTVGPSAASTSSSGARPACLGRNTHASYASHTSATPCIASFTCKSRHRIRFDP